jgi:hypothetical protein
MHILLIDMTGPSILLVQMKSVDRAAQPPAPMVVMMIRTISVIFQRVPDINWAQR